MDWKGLLSGVKKFSTGLGCIWLSVAFVVPMLGSFKLRRKIQCTTGYCPYLVDCYISRPTTSWWAPRCRMWCSVCETFYLTAARVVNCKHKTSRKIHAGANVGCDACKSCIIMHRGAGLTHDSIKRVLKVLI